MHETVAERVWEIAEPLAVHEGLEVVDVEFHRESRGTVLRIYLDRQGGGGGVSLADLSRVSRQLGDLLDVHDAVPGSYNLEVSSPGINRRLRRPDHFRRYVGKRVRVRTVGPLDGRRGFLGILEAVRPEGIVVCEPSGSHVIRFSDIARANYEPEG
ncbi:MAG: ribosome maturation factor RimP [Candidatus Binatia bacterium]